MFWSLLLGYFLGTISPSAMLGKRKHVNLKEEGTGNLGASNVIWLLGKKDGLFVLVFDICKSILAGKVARYLFPQLALAGMIACLGAVIGHIWPWNLGFRGGKGLACYGGMVLYYDLRLFWFYLIFGVALLVIVNRSVVLPIFVSISFPLIVWFTSQDLGVLIVAVITSVIILCIHKDNYHRVDRGEEAPMRQLIADTFKKHE